jgi:hypothetical protein
LFKITACGALGAFSAWLPKFNEVGKNITGSSPIPDNATV